MDDVHTFFSKKKRNIRCLIHQNVRNYVLLPPLLPGLLGSPGHPPFWVTLVTRSYCWWICGSVKGQGLPWKFWKSSRIAEQSRDYGWGTLEWFACCWDIFKALLVFGTVIFFWRMFRICHNISPKKQGNHDLNRTKLSSHIHRNAKVYDLCISSNAVLLYPASIIFAAAWGTALDEGRNRMSGCFGWRRFSWTRQVWDTTTKAKPGRCEVMHHSAPVSKRCAQETLVCDFDINVLMVLMTCFLAWIWRCSSFFFSDCHVVTDFEGNELRFFPIFVVVSVSHTHTLTNWLGWVLRKRTKIPFRRCGRPHAFEILVLLVLLVVPSEMFSLQIAGSTSCNETHPLQSWLGQSGHAGLWFSSESKYEHTNIFFHFHIYQLKKSLHLRRKTAREWLHLENLATKRSLQKPQLSVRAPAEQNACELFRSKKVKVSELLESSMRNVKSVMRWRWVGGNDVFTLYLLDIDHIRLDVCWFSISTW